MPQRDKPIPDEWKYYPDVEESSRYELEDSDLFFPSIRNGKSNLICICEDDEEVREFVERYLADFIVLPELPCYSSNFHTNDIVAILVRVKKFVEEDCFKRYNTNYSHNEDWKSFDRFIKEVAMSWGGNLKERSPHLDDESYGAALVRSEERLINLDHFPEHIKKMCKVVEYYTHRNKVIFILPIDPFIRDRNYFLTRYGFAGLLFV